MASGSEFTPEQQRRMAERLREGRRYPGRPASVRVIETHISWVFLTDRRAYKLKKALDLGFLDYSTLARRRHCAEEELRLNRRTAPDLYLGLLPVTGSTEEPMVGGDGPLIDWLVEMSRFPDGSLMAEQLAQGSVGAGAVDRLAEAVAGFHRAIPPVPTTLPYGEPDWVARPVAENFLQIAERLGGAEAERLVPLRRWSEERLDALRDLMQERRTGGFVRECHGDLHLGNILLLEGRPVLFDCIEFSESLRWIDVLSEVAFLVMDLEDRGRPDLAHRALNGYLERTGDYAGLPLLRYYQTYRAMVRAKVAAIRLGQTPPGQREAVQAEYEGYITLAERYIRPGRPALLATHGFSGSGKSFATLPLVEQLGAVRLRSDIERKRLFGLAPEADSASDTAGGIYTKEATRRTYARLGELAEAIIAAGLPAVIDATCLHRWQRDGLRELAERLQVPFLLLDFQADAQTLRERVQQRTAGGDDASEADLAVLNHQLDHHDPIEPDEEKGRIVITPATAAGLPERLRPLMGDSP